jgi:hypothetical protein
MITNIHAHVTTDPAAQLKRAREAGVDRTVLLSTRQHPEKPQTLEGMRAEWNGLNRVISGAASPDEGFRSAATELLAALDAHPGETFGFANVRLGKDAESVAAWLDPYLSRPDIRGIGELTPAPDNAALIEPVLAVSADRGGLPVLVHGYSPSTAGDIRTYAELAARYPGVPLISARRLIAIVGPEKTAARPAEFIADTTAAWFWAPRTRFSRQRVTTSSE